MLIKNVHIESQEAVKDVRIEDGKFVEIAETIERRDNEEVIEGNGKLLLPPFVDSHVHLDATRTAGQPEWNETGTLFDGIRIWEQRVKTITKEDVKTRAKETIREQVANGLQVVRSHVDVTGPNLLALEALLELKEELKDIVELQLVAFPQSGILSTPNGKANMEQAVKMGVDVIGGIPHFEFNRDYGVESLKFLVDLAERYDRLVDVHCDEIDDPNSRHLEVLATLAYETGMGDKVTASHTTAMSSYNDAYTYKLFRLLGMAGLNFVANPEVNLHLGGRFDTYPKRRSMTRIKELSKAGINVSFGEDDIKDPWYPMGNGNMLDQVQVGILAGGLMGYSQVQEAYKFVTNNAARTLHIQDHYGIEVGKPANCILLNQTNFYDVLNEHAEVLYSIRGGKVLVETKPKEVSLKF
ncbi:cytosine deaminase [Secundilactobacillus oryzae JCM 18671]|uniref:Cytosine deaminase n=1 Tax=Secundilactobacillus oryzae JCM 18671 TaxID=1291743 RepID=A0A081BKV5_9LACO|nr:cytosine deaminase [Secundilactobacillus oryzae]GAK48673.1 cytosine deaminase [Secundilactobacillus oryzae JCM 18671]